MTSAPFPWAVVGADAIGGLAQEAGVATATVDVGGRWVAVLEADAA
jgi:hypothetical protein